MIYFVQQGITGPIKIGWTQGTMEDRLRSLQCANPETLIVRAVIRHGGRATERWLHRAFNYCRIRGEWFAPDTLLLRLIEAIQDAAADGADDEVMRRLYKYMARERPEYKPGRVGRPRKRKVMERIGREISEGSLTIRRSDDSLAESE